MVESAAPRRRPILLDRLRKFEVLDVATLETSFTFRANAGLAAALAFLGS
jgi:hypothetical protein